MSSFRAFRITNDDGKVQRLDRRRHARRADAGRRRHQGGVLERQLQGRSRRDGHGQDPRSGSRSSAASTWPERSRRAPIRDSATATACSSPAMTWACRRTAATHRIVRVPADWVVRLPDGLTSKDAMVLGTAGFTAGLAIVRLERNGLAPGQGPIAVTGATRRRRQRRDRRARAARIRRDGHHRQGRCARVRASRSARATSCRVRRWRWGPGRSKRRRWAGAVDAVGGDLLAWLTRTTSHWGGIASTGLTGGVELRTTVMPFILRGVSLIGIDSAMCPMEIARRGVAATGHRHEATGPRVDRARDRTRWPARRIRYTDQRQGPRTLRGEPCTPVLTCQSQLPDKASSHARSVHRRKSAEAVVARPAQHAQGAVACLRGRSAGSAERRRASRDPRAGRSRPRDCDRRRAAPAALHLGISRRSDRRRHGTTRAADDRAVAGTPRRPRSRASSEPSSEPGPCSSTPAGSRAR